MNDILKDLEQLAHALDADDVPGEDRVFLCEPGPEMVRALESVMGLIEHEVVE